MNNDQVKEITLPKVRQAQIGFLALLAAGTLLGLLAIHIDPKGLATVVAGWLSFVATLFIAMLTWIYVRTMRETLEVMRRQLRFSLDAVEATQMQARATQASVEVMREQANATQASVEVMRQQSQATQATAEIMRAQFEAAIPKVRIEPHSPVFTWTAGDEVLTNIRATLRMANTSIANPVTVRLEKAAIADPCFMYTQLTFFSDGELPSSVVSLAAGETRDVVFQLTATDQRRIPPDQRTQRPHGMTIEMTLYTIFEGFRDLRFTCLPEREEESRGANA